MTLVKRTYTAHSTYITAQNLNDIQDHIIALENDNLDSRLDALEPVVSALNGKWTTHTIEHREGWQVTLTAGKIYLLVIAKQNTNIAERLGLYIISAYHTDTDSANGTAIRVVAGSSIATVAAASLTLAVAVTDVDYVNCTLIQMN